MALDWTYWIPAVAVQAVVAVLFLFFRDRLSEWFAGAIRYRYDAKLEELRSDLSRQADAYHAQTKARDQELASLREGALSALLSRQSGLDQRRLEAVDRLWCHAVKHAKRKSLVIMLSYLDMNKMSKLASGRSQEAKSFQEFGEGLWKAFNLEDGLTTEDAAHERPFVTPIAWALYSAYSTICSLPVMQLAVLKSGFESEGMLDDKAMILVVKAALPDHTELLNKFGTKSFPHLLPLLEQRLLNELLSGLDAHARPMERIQQAADILEAVDKVAAQRESARLPANVADMKEVIV